MPCALGKQEAVGKHGGGLTAELKVQTKVELLNVETVCWSSFCLQGIRCPGEKTLRSFQHRRLWREEIEGISKDGLSRTHGARISRTQGEGRIH